MVEQPPSCTSFSSRSDVLPTNHRDRPSWFATGCSVLLWTLAPKLTLVSAIGLPDRDAKHSPEVCDLTT
jgi:hypothetical protein